MTIGLRSLPVSLHSCPQPSSPFITPISAPLPRSSTSFYPHEIPHHLTESEIFLPLVTLLLMGK